MSLYDIELLQHIFYRSECILKYIERHKNNMDLLDCEAITNTIMNELVSHGIVDPNTQSLDFQNLKIVDDLDHIVYVEHPFVVGIPEEFKAKGRDKIVSVTGGYPISVHMARPAGNTHFCIYDANTAMSCLFDEFKFVEAKYFSPTRNQELTDLRPFLSIDYRGAEYYVDLLTKRMFRRDLFDYIYGIRITSEISNKDFNEKQKEYYNDQTSPSSIAAYATLININYMFMQYLDEFPKMEEFNYEYNLSREYFKEAFVKADNMLEIMHRIKK